MKEFKNYVSVKGTKEELEAFAEELKKLGYTPDDGISKRNKGKSYGEWWSDKLTNITCYEDGVYAYHMINSAYMKFTLPQQKEEALKAASETI